MKKRILWVEDDYYAIRGLMRPLERAGFQIDAATSAAVGYQLASQWKTYDLIVVDLILPLSDDDHALPSVVKSWSREEYIGIGLLTPPVGIAVYIASNQAGVPVAEGFRKTAPFIIPLVVTLLLITYIPGFVLWLPRLLFG